ncbi:MAG: carboxypeptidase regulatory-like domain-containing protein [Candidatus Zixiibacteriota bacterium]|nr:MAG: carboxypeptidase regulatory-like domain-containing protein [candidate division Zixibacteria bacterium]
MRIRFLEKREFKIIIFSGLMLLVLSSHGWAQNEGDTIWTRVYGDTIDQMANSVVQTLYGDYAVAGLTGGFNTADFWLLKVDPNGATSWTHTYAAADNEQAQSVKRASDGGYIMAGSVLDSSGMSAHNLYVVRTYPWGDIRWTRRSGGLGSACAYDIEITPDLGYIIVGKTALPFSDYDIYLVKLDAGGNTVWTRVYGGPDHQEGYDVELTSDGGYVITGQTGTSPDYDVYLIKVDADGDSLWGQTWGDTLIDVGYSVKATSDGGYIIAGSTEQPPGGTLDAYFIKTDSSGNTLWTRIYGGSYTDEAYSIYPAYGDNYIATGYFGVSDRDFDLHLLKLDAGGDTLWTRLYGGLDRDRGNSVIQALDGSYLVAGGSASFSPGHYQAYLLKIAGPQQYGAIVGQVSNEVERELIRDVHVSAGQYETWTGLAGLYELGGVLTGTYDVSFSHPDHRDTIITGVQVTSGNTTSLNVQMASLYGGIAGIVFDEIERAPIESVYVSAGQYETWTGPYGTYHLDGVLPGIYEVSFSHPDHRDTVVTDVQVTPGRTTSLNVQMALDYYGSIAGHVSDEIERAPIESVYVSAGQYETWTDQYGNYDLDSVSTGIYDVSFSHPDYRDTTVAGVEVISGNVTALDVLMTTTAVGCDYVAGDVNGSDNYNGLDITYGVAFFKGGPEPLCPVCPPCPDWNYCGDVNGSCNYNGLDITYGVAYFKGGPDPMFCADCPPQP